MCGVAFTTGDRARLIQMLAAIEHRGRDQQGLMAWRGLQFGFNRLAIVDRWNYDADQPLETSNSITMFNGEIYNVGDIWEGLNAYEPKLSSAVEVVVIDRLLATNEQFWRVLDGYFGIVRLDKSRQTITVSRDLIGVIPLYYTQRPFEIASEKKALDGRAAVHEVRAGETIVFDLGGRVVDRHQFDPYSLHLEDIDVAHLTFLVKRAVQRRIDHAQVPITLALSGGLDSAVVLAAARATGRLDAIIEAVTVTTDRSDAQTIRAVDLARAWGVEHTIVDVTDEMIEQHRALIAYHLEDDGNPIKFGGMVRNYFTAMHARGKVILCGEGADELFGGYPPHLAVRGLAREWKCLSSLRSMPAINLDRVNKGGMAFTKEYRAPFVDRALVLYAMGCKKSHNKWWLRRVAQRLEVPDDIILAPKYTSEETRLRGMEGGR